MRELPGGAGWPGPGTVEPRVGGVCGVRVSSLCVFQLGCTRTPLGETDLQGKAQSWWPAGRRIRSCRCVGRDPGTQSWTFQSFGGQKRASGRKGPQGRPVVRGEGTVGPGSAPCRPAGLLAGLGSLQGVPTRQGFLYLNLNPHHSSEALHPDWGDLALKLGATWGRGQVGGLPGRSVGWQRPGKLRCALPRPGASWRVPTREQAGHLARCPQGAPASPLPCTPREAAMGQELRCQATWPHASLSIPCTPLGRSCDLLLQRVPAPGGRGRL